ncbi:MAG: hypothetical protein LBD75_07500 [Candidatus Peribacteria bacterium]|jgi:hypothetical protein|nr:hypothetical protein [Candidatus Peribacteria bacterium]
MTTFLSKVCIFFSNIFYGTDIGKYRPFKLFIPWVMKNSYQKGIYTTKHGIKMDLDPQNCVDYGIIHQGIWEKDITALLVKYLQPGDSFLDI